MAAKPTSPNKEFIVLKAVIEESLPGGTFKVKLENGQEILAHLSGKMRKFRIRLTHGDEVQLEVSPYDLTKGRITYRL
ncbi:MAG: translation initiation factor IF-1 [Patescibacteria group bacterium]|nr:translation initiation factor IF-1 [Patescibacteria group bacterium]MBU2508863.1 translation initiation factor IF-1 [Patescibacteria group bacterium]